MKIINKSTKDSNITGQFYSIKEISGKKEDKLSQVRFVLLQGLMLDTSLIQKSQSTEEKNVKLAK
ncbi:2406_t:CDS:2 [Cetraspora pellucida]|uniref:2406_t:CDS:1 n=1 Tax=Cetraspora pellucida TaxID=1433469 RepID=A0A9N8WP60_9GLOM|nr:2406_t:CDS:2 [Cetraspora pellucida]